MAHTLRAAAAFAALLAACLLGSASAGVQFDTGLQYPGITGTIPACVAAHAPDGVQRCACRSLCSCVGGTCRGPSDNSDGLEMHICLDPCTKTFKIRNLLIASRKLSQGLRGRRGLVRLFPISPAPHPLLPT